jgi:hypothetical protein
MAQLPVSRQRWTPPAARLEGDRLLKARAAQQRVKDAALQATAEAKMVEAQAEKHLAETVDKLEEDLKRLTDNIPKIMPAGGGGRRMVRKVLAKDYDLPEGLGSAAGNDTEDFATAAQGAAADSAVQPGDIGTAAAEDVEFFATAEQGGKADTALQPADVPNNSDLSVSGSSVARRDNVKAYVDTLTNKIANIKTPYDYGALPSDSYTADQSVAVQALLDAVRASYNATLGGFTLIADFAGRFWAVDDSIDMTMLRQPGMRIQNGGLLGRCTGKIVLDCAGTNSIVIENFEVQGDKTNTPSVGVLLSRAIENGAPNGCPNHKLFNVRTDGYFSKAGRINFACEVALEDGCWWDNKSRSIDAYAAITCGHAGTLDDYVGGLTSDYCTLPTALNGAQSCILHNMTQPHILRTSDIAIQITSITKANPGVVTVNAASLLASGLANGDKVYFHNNAGMTQLNGTVQTVANINTGAGTFELSGTNTTGYGTFTGGFLWNQTGPAFLLNGVTMMHGRSGYLLTYGSPGIVVDLKNGGAASGVDLEFSLEAQPPSLVRFDRGSSPVVCQGIRLHDLSANQNFSDSVVTDVGSGLIRIDGCDIQVNNMGVAPPNKAFKNPANFALRNARIEMPLVAALNANTDFSSFSGDMIAYDSAPYIRRYGAGYYGGPTFYAGTTLAAALTASLSEDGANNGPYIDIDRVSASPSANDGLGGVRFLGRDSAGNLTAYGVIRARLLDPVNTSEDGRIEFVVPVAGADTMSFFIQGRGLFDGAVQVVTQRQTGYTTAAGTGNKNAGAINVGTITATDGNLQAVAAWVKSIHDALATHGLIGT